MGKGLFDDLVVKGANFDRYSDKNHEYEDKLKIKNIEQQIEEFDKSEKTEVWAKRLFEFYIVQFDENENLLKSASNFNELEKLLQLAQDIIEQQKIARQEKAEREAELKFRKQAEYENSCKNSARDYDNEINYLFNQKSKGKFWCENLDNLILNINNSNDDVKSRIENINKLEIMENISKTVKIAVDYDNQISWLENFNKDKNWRYLVISKYSKIKKEDEQLKFIQYMVKLDLLASFVDEANELNEAEESAKQQQEEAEKLRKIKQQEEEKRIALEEKQRELEEKERLLKEEQEKIARENKIKEEQELKNKQQLSKELIHSDFECSMDGNELKLKKIKNKNIISIIIPDGIDIICKDALVLCKKATDITIPQSVKMIENGVLLPCKKLAKITVDKKNHNYTSLDDVLYNKSKRLLIYYPPQKQQNRFDCPDTLKEVGESAFENNNYIQTFFASNETQIIGPYAFRNCKSLYYVGFCYINKIYKGAFHNCKKLSSIFQHLTIEIQGDIFKGCRKLDKSKLKHKNFQ